MTPPPIGAVVLAGAGIFTILQGPELNLTLTVAAFTIFFIYGVMGVIIRFNCSSQADNLYKLSEIFVETAPLGFITTEFALQSSKLSDVAYAFAILGILPVLGEFIIDQCKNQKVKDFTIFANGIALIAIAITDGNPYIGALGSVAILIQTSQPYIADKLDISTRQIAPLGYAVFCILSYLILNVLAATYGIHKYTKEYHGYGWSYMLYQIIRIHGIIGIFHYYIKHEKIKQIFEISYNIAQILPLPFMNTEIFLAAGTSIDLATLHGVTGLVPLIYDILFNDADDTNEDFKNIVVIGNATSLLLFSVTEGKILYFLLAIIGFMNRCIIGKLNSSSENSLSFGLTIFCLIGNRIINTDLNINVK